MGQIKNIKLHIVTDIKVLKVLCLRHLKTKQNSPYKKDYPCQVNQQNQHEPWTNATHATSNHPLEGRDRLLTRNPTTHQQHQRMRGRSRCHPNNTWTKGYGQTNR